jgi:hypothetical protein
MREQIDPPRHHEPGDAGGCGVDCGLRSSIRNLSIAPMENSEWFMTDRVARMIPYFIALVVFLTSLRNLSSWSSLNIIDAPRHVLNGAFVYDLVRTGNLTHPFQYGKQFYSRFPAISIPYHPPLFPVIESILYAIFGVSLVAARIPVALATGVCALLLYLLVMRTHQSAWLAAAATCTFITLPISQSLATDVMLEFPSLAFTLGALYCLRDMEYGFPPWRAFPFAVLAGAAVWTKQHAVFLGLVPFILIFLHGNWRLLRGVPLWASSILLGLIVLAFMTMSVPVQHVGVTSQFAPAGYLWQIMIFNVNWYSEALGWTLGWVVKALVLVSVGAFLAIPWLRRLPENRLYLAWTLALVPLLLTTTKHDIRYLVYGLPAIIVLGFDGLRRACMRVLPARFVPAVIGLVAVGLTLQQTCKTVGVRLTDAAHKEVARYLKDRGSRRMVYCGTRVAKLALAVRVLDPESRTIMIRGDKLDKSMFTPESFERFAWRFGVDTVVLEPVKEERQWSRLVSSPAPSMVQARVVTNTGDNLNDIVIYDFTNPSSHPESHLQIPIRYTDGALNLDL